MCTRTFIDGVRINLIKNTDGEYLKGMKTFKRIDLMPNKQGYTPERHQQKNKKLGKQS